MQGVIGGLPGAPGRPGIPGVPGRPGFPGVPRGPAGPWMQQPSQEFIAWRAVRFAGRGALLMWFTSLQMSFTELLQMSIS